MNIYLHTLGLFLIISMLSCQQGSTDGSTDVNAKQAKELLASDREIIVLDVRTPQEFEQGHVQGAVNIDFMDSDFEEKVLKLDKSGTYLLYCHSGNRSGKATAKLKDHDFKNIYNATAGFPELKAEGVPSTR